MRKACLAVGHVLVPVVSESMRADGKRERGRDGDARFRFVMRDGTLNLLSLKGLSLGVDRVWVVC